MRRARILSLSVLLLACGCVAPVFNSPMTLSTRSIAGENARELETVTATSSSYFFVLIPIPADPRDLYDDLMVAAKRAGGNAVIDVQVRSQSTFAWMFPPIVVSTIEATGTAAIVE